MDIIRGMGMDESAKKEVQERWPEIIEYVCRKGRASNAAKRTWLEPLNVVAVDRDIVYVEFYEAVYVPYIRKRYTDLFEEAFRTVLKRPYRVYFFWNKVTLLNEKKERLN